jgi:hypothetical protein
MARTTRINGTPTIDVIATPAAPKVRTRTRTPEQIEASRVKAAAKAAAQEAAAKEADTALMTIQANAKRIRTHVSYGLGAVATSVLMLSLWHSSSAIADLTHQPLWRGFLLAVGIDCGLILAEVAHLLSKCPTTRRWSLSTVILCISVSIVLNTHTCWDKHETMRLAFAWVLGIIIPVLVLLLSRIASHLMEEK